MKKLFIFAMFFCKSYSLINVIGAGYVGLVLGVGLAELGFPLICSDIDKKKINSLLKAEISFYEPGLKDLVEKNLNKSSLNFTTDIPQAVKDSSIIFVAVGAPMKKGGDADLSSIYKVIDFISENLNGYKIIAIKSTVLIGVVSN